MASKEFHDLQERLAAAPAAPPPTDLDELRARIDTSMGKLPLAPDTSAADVDANGVHAILCTRTGSSDDPTFVYFHGGGYRMASAIAYRAYGSQLAAATHTRVLLVDYRLAPEHPFPAAVDDAVTAYQWVLGTGVAPARVVIGGDSAGGGLAAALLLACRARSVPLPAGAICLSPWADLTNTAESFRSRADTDKLFAKSAADDAAALYLGGADPTDPLASPVFGDWTGMPPLLVQVSDAEVLVDDAARLADAARAARVPVEHHSYPEMPHVWQLSYPAFPEAVDAVDKIAAFVRRVTG